MSSRLDYLGVKRGSIVQSDDGAMQDESIDGEEEQTK